MEWIKELWTMLSHLQILDLILSAVMVVILDLFSIHVIAAASREAELCRKRWQKVSDDMELCWEEKDKNNKKIIHHYPLEADEILIGRHSSADIRLNYATVSRYHAVLTVTAKKWSIEDLKSRDGTYVNDKKIDKPKKLSAGSKIQLGEIQLYLQKRGHDQEQNE